MIQPPGELSVHRRLTQFFIEPVSMKQEKAHL